MSGKKDVHAWAPHVSMPPTRPGSIVRYQVPGQLKRHSFLESLCNVAVGLLIAFTSQIVFFPLVGVQASLTQNLAISGIFTAISVVRAYTIRRFFNGRT